MVPALAHGFAIAELTIGGLLPSIGTECRERSERLGRAWSGG